jgi:hypothetical protein
MCNKDRVKGKIKTGFLIRREQRWKNIGKEKFMESKCDK